MAAASSLAEVIVVESQVFLLEAIEANSKLMKFFNFFFFFLEKEKEMRGRDSPTRHAKFVNTKSQVWKSNN